MMSRIFGACLGGTTRGAHQALDFNAVSLISPPNFGSGGGNCLPLIVVVAPAEPGVPVVWISSRAESCKAAPSKRLRAVSVLSFIMVLCLCSLLWCGSVVKESVAGNQCSVVSGQGWSKVACSCDEIDSGL